VREHPSNWRACPCPRLRRCSAAAPGCRRLQPACVRIPLPAILYLPLSPGLLSSGLPRSEMLRLARLGLRLQPGPFLTVKGSPLESFAGNCSSSPPSQLLQLSDAPVPELCSPDRPRTSSNTSANIASLSSPLERASRAAPRPAAFDGSVQVSCPVNIVLFLVALWVSC
jgi:hypothetical protein